MQLLEFIPLYMERLWGGRVFESKLGRKLPEGKQFGESWEIVDRPDQQSIVASGPLAGQTLRELLTHSASKIMGPHYDPQRPFPILIKWLDCHKRLSLQVHPSIEIAAELKGEPKTENWYIADADSKASIIAGLRPNVTRELFERAMAEGTLENCVQTLPTNAGDHILIKSGCIHAINAGNLILEIQQNSDTTYRLDDWNRLGLNGKPQQLHMHKALQSINFSMPQAKLHKADADRTVIADCKEFRIQKFNLTPDDVPITFPSHEQPRLLHIVSGSLYDLVSGQNLEHSKNYLQPHTTELSLVAKKKTTLLVTDKFLAQDDS